MKIKYLLLAVLSIFAPIKAAIFTVGVLVFVDLILGVMAAKKRGEHITSGGFRRTISKLFIFEVCLLLAYLTETYLMGGLLPVAKIAAAFIGMTEYTSILENLNEINGAPVFKKLIGILSKKEDESIGTGNNEPPASA